MVLSAALDVLVGRPAELAPARGSGKLLGQLAEQPVCGTPPAAPASCPSAELVHHHAARPPVAARFRALQGPVLTRSRQTRALS
jgi:hypothetical protein